MAGRESSSSSGVLPAEVSLMSIDYFNYQLQKSEKEYIEIEGRQTPSSGTHLKPGSRLEIIK